MAISENLVSAREAANILGITPARIGLLCRQGRFKGAEKIGVGWIIPREAVTNFKRLPPGMKPRGYDEKKLLEQVIHEANNLKEDDNHVQQR